MQPTVIVCDVDGTLLNDHNVVTDFTRNSLDWLHTQGVPVVLATGRPPRDMPEVLGQLPFQPLCVCANGSVIFNSATDELSYTQVLSADHVKDCIESISAVLPGASYGIESLGMQGNFYCDATYEHPYTNPPAERLSDRTQLYQDSLKLLVSVPGIGSAQLLEKVQEILHHTYSVCYFHDDGLVEIAHQGTNKANGLLAATSSHQLSLERVVAFGDMNNDLECIKFAWHGVAMANACPEVKEATPFHTLSHNHDGIAYELVKFWPSLRQFEPITNSCGHR